MCSRLTGGILDAMNEVGWCYLEGFGCKKDKVRSRNLNLIPIQSHLITHRPHLKHPPHSLTHLPPSHQAPTPLPSHPLIPERGGRPPNPEDPSKEARLHMHYRWSQQSTTGSLRRAGIRLSGMDGESTLFTCCVLFFTPTPTLSSMSRRCCALVSCVRYASTSHRVTPPAVLCAADSFS